MLSVVVLSVILSVVVAPIEQQLYLQWAVSHSKQLSCRYKYIFK